jgi:hypothetical protein
VGEAIVVEGLRFQISDFRFQIIVVGVKLTEELKVLRCGRKSMKSKAWSFGKTKESKKVMLGEDMW